MDTYQKHRYWNTRANKNHQMNSDKQRQENVRRRPTFNKNRPKLNNSRFKSSGNTQRRQIKQRGKMVNHDWVTTKNAVC